MFPWRVAPPHKPLRSRRPFIAFKSEINTIMNHHNLAKKVNPAPSMWINDCPQALEYYRRTGLWAKLRARLPAWVGGRPVHTLTPERTRHALTCLTSTALSLESQRRLAGSKGRTREVERLTLRIAQSKVAQSKIKRVV